MKRTVNYEGVTATPLFLTVHFTVGQGSARRILTVKVPIAHLLAPEVTSAIDRHVRAALRDQWNAGQETIPW